MLLTETQQAIVGKKKYILTQQRKKYKMDGITSDKACVTVGHVKRND